MDDEEEAIVSMLRDFYISEGKWEALVVQQRYAKDAPSTIIAGEIPAQTFAIESDLKYHINFLNAQNIGFFTDMAIGRTFVRDHAQGKNILNLFFLYLFVFRSRNRRWCSISFQCRYEQKCPNNWTRKSPTKWT